MHCIERADAERRIANERYLVEMEKRRALESDLYALEARLQAVQTAAPEPTELDGREAAEREEMQRHRRQVLEEQRRRRDEASWSHAQAKLENEQRRIYEQNKEVRGDPLGAAYEIRINNKLTVRYCTRRSTKKHWRSSQVRRSPSASST